jgi:hypothetical protein
VPAADPELAAIAATLAALATLDEPARRRVVGYLTARFEASNP